MKLSSILIGLTVAVLLVVSTTAAPNVEILEDTFNFGKVAQKRILTHHFWIKSIGDDTLHITKVEPGCSCTQAPLKDSVLAPGDSTALEIILNTGWFRGHVSKRPYIITNASEDKVYLKIYAEIILDPENAGPLMVRPDRLDVSQFGEKPRRRAKFHIENRTDQDLNLVVTDSSMKSFEIKIPNKIPAGETVEGQIRVYEDKVATGFEESITFQVDDFEVSVYSLAIKRDYRPKTGDSTQSSD